MLDGVRRFAASYDGRLVTETMLLDEMGRSGALRRLTHEGRRFYLRRFDAPGR